MTRNRTVALSLWLVALMPIRLASQTVTAAMLSGSWRARALSAAAQSLTFDADGHVLILRDGVARAYTAKPDTSAKDPSTLRLALIEPNGHTDSLTVRIRGRSEIDVMRISHPRAPGDTLVRYVRASPPDTRELRAKLERALHP